MKENQQSTPQNKLDVGDKKLISVSRSQSFSGPIPPPAILDGYEKILPGLADRIMKMAESQSEHRKDLESKVILHDRIKSMLGLIFAFLIVIVAIIAGVYLVIKGMPVTGGVFSLMPLATIVGAFIYQQKEKDKQS